MKTSALLIRLLKLIALILLTTPFVIMGFFAGILLESFLIGKYWGSRVLEEVAEK